MNSNNLKSSTLLSHNSKFEPNHNISTQPLALVSPFNPLNQPTQQQRKSIARIYVEQARLYFQEQNWQNAIIACKNALELDSKIADAYKILGNILKRTGRKAEALGVYAKALTIEPNCANIYANLGSFYAEQQNWQQALDYYQQAVILDPKLAGAYRSLAQVWEELGDFTQALECFCQAVNLEPEILTPEKYFSFGKELYHQGRVKEASILYTHGVKLAPQAKSELAQLVKMLEELQEWQQAVAYYHQLISLSDGSELPTTSNHKPIKSLLAHSKLKTSKISGQKLLSSSSNRQLESAISTSSSNPKLLSTQSHNRLTIVKDSLKKTEANPEEIASEKPYDNNQKLSAVSLNNLGSTCAQKQQWLKAISCYQEAVQLNPNLAKTHRNLAKVYTKIGELDKAHLCWYEAYILEPQEVKALEYFNLAKKLLQQSEVDKAIICLQNTVRLQPDFERAYLILGKLFENAGKIEQAKSCYSKLKRRHLDERELQ
jgi:tetratricopeptide (TPR) repeat protein